ncbi:hypothetical protein ON010_g2446 [Phytophthora cinnamomi]|nr:hypothetical protein ON010_g2446 [Phytophthora cinnamomi]
MNPIRVRFFLAELALQSLFAVTLVQPLLTHVGLAAMELAESVESAVDLGGAEVGTDLASVPAHHEKRHGGLRFIKEGGHAKREGFVVAGG